MALFVIAAGVLLMLGGATALLAGFDIVMTERGSAMTIGGTIALSSGVVAVGIGFALLRLSQILRSLETRNAKPSRTLPHTDRTVVPAPLAAAEPSGDIPVRPPEPNFEPLRASPMPSPSFSPPSFLPPLSPSIGKTVALGTAGLLVAGVVSAAYAKSPSSKEDDLDNDLSKADKPTGFITPPVTPDLEAELSLALAETETSADRDRQFTTGLSEFLSNPNSHSEKNGLDEDTSYSSDVTANADISMTTAQTNEPPASALDELSDAVNSLSVEQSDQEDQSDTIILADVSLAQAAIAEEPVKDAEDEAPSHDILRPGILRTYNSGGKYYTMYVDGSVEASTDEGVERFNSMDELRAHLAGT